MNGKYSFKRNVSILLLVLAVIVWGHFRVYFGGEFFVVKIIVKSNYSLKNTIVNLENFLEKSRLSMKEDYPAIKRELEEMDILDTDQEIINKLDSDMKLHFYEKIRNLYSE